MDDTIMDQKCLCGRIDVMRAAKWISLCDMIGNLFLSVYLTDLAMKETIFVPFVLSVLFLAILSAVYYVGIEKENDSLMIPMIVSKVILSLMIGLMMIFSWIAYALSLFSLIHVQSPFASFMTADYLFLLSAALAIGFVVLLRLLFVLYEAYRLVKKENDRKLISDTFVAFEPSRMTFRPTYV